MDEENEIEFIKMKIGAELMINKVKQYHNYIFDLYGTLIDIHTNEEKEILWEQLAEFYKKQGANYETKELKNAYKDLVKAEHSTYSHEAYPEIQLEYVFQKMFQQKGMNVSLDVSIEAGQLFRTLSTEYIQLYEHTHSLLKALKEKGKHIYLLSNAQEIFTVPELEKLDLLQYFDSILISSTEQCKKPDEKFFRILLERYHLKVEECLMIGNDETTDIEGAYKIGMDSFYIHSNLSPELTKQSKSTYALMEMDLKKVKEMLVG